MKLSQDEEVYMYVSALLEERLIHYRGKQKQIDQPYMSN